MANKRKSKGATKKRSTMNLRPLLKPAGVGLVLILLVSALVVAGSKIGGMHWTPMPVENVELSTVLVYQSNESFEVVAKPFIGKSLLTTDVDEVREVIQSLPWIRSAAVGKKWPNSLVVDVTEYQPVAIWNGQRVLNSEGLALEQPVVEMELATLNGPEQSALEVMEHYLQFSRVIDSVDAQVKKVTLHSRGAWELEITYAIEIALGDRNVLERSRRVVDVIRAHDEIKTIKSIDARYPNGVAIAYHEIEEIEVQQ
ncbi:FtsQ-type POTRA domain-containing protein [Reinekea marina]|nr:FtsQ-type POTRA domain-containing protein [Reinekea marina]MDN3650523.1 FtsQ-type POTRA domain-containing protein [Reinekea marina]